MAKSSKPTGFETLAQETALYPQEKTAKIRRSQKSFFLGVPKEISFEENRITLTPEAVGLLVNNGHKIWIETAAGEKAKYNDHDYSGLLFQSLFPTDPEALRDWSEEKAAQQ